MSLKYVDEKSDQISPKDSKDNRTSSAKLKEKLTSFEIRIQVSIIKLAHIRRECDIAAGFNGLLRDRISGVAISHNLNSYQAVILIFACVASERNVVCAADIKAVSLCSNIRG
jgi:hypothetical protein